MPMTAAELRKHLDEAPERYRAALVAAMPGVSANVAYADDRRAVQVICTDGRRRRLTWQFDAAELAGARDPEKFVVSMIRGQWEA